MQVNKIDSVGFGSRVKIYAAENKENNLLYYQVCKFIENEKHKFPATFATDKIELPYVTKVLLDKLKELKIKYKEF